MAIEWRQAEPSDVGRLARFADVPGDDWSYGLLDGFDSQESVFECVTTEGEDCELFLICEVQEISK